MTSTAARPSLPVWPTVSAAFASVPANWLAAIKIFWAWGAILCVFHAARWMILLDVVERSFSTFFTLVLLHTVIGALAFGSMAVAWHRLMLLGEQPPAIHLRVDGRARRYILRFLLIALVALPIQVLCALLLLPALGALAFPSPGSPPSAGRLLAMNLMGLIISLPAIAVTIRLSVSLPAIAIGRTMTLRETWRLTSGNALELCGGTLLLYVPSYAIGMGVVLLPGGQDGSLPVILSIIAVGVLSTVAAISFLSVSYRFLTATALPDDPPAG
jgi:hypothetical protein